MKKFIYIFLIFIVLILVIVGLSLFSGKSNFSIINDNLTNNNYVLSNDKKIYTKISNGTSLDEFYDISSKMTNTKYEEYTFNTYSYDLTLFSIIFTNGNYYTCSIIDNLHSENTNYSCEFTYKNNSFIFTGKLNNNSITCNNDKLSKKQVDGYCKYIGNKIDEFNLEKNQLISNKEFSNLMKKEKQEIIEED